MKRLFHIFLSIAAVCSCSTVNLVPDGKYRLALTDISITGENHLKPSDISPYIKQASNTRFLGLSPLVCIYGWSGGSDKGLGKAFKKIGEAPVIYNQKLVGASIENITAHLNHIGYYHPVVKAVEMPSGKKMKLLYKVDPGNRTAIDSIVYSLPENREFRALFSKDSVNSNVTKGSYISEELMEKESARSAAFFRENGYYLFSKNNYFFSADTLTYPGRAVLTYSVKTYTRGATDTTISNLGRFRFGAVNIFRPQDLKFRESVLRKMCTIVPGSLYNDSEINKTYSRLSSLRVFNSVMLETEPVDSGTIDCNISLERAKLMGFKLNLEASATYTGLYGISPQLSFFHRNIFHGGEWLNLAFSGNFQFKPNETTRATEFGISAGISLPDVLFFEKLSKKTSNPTRTEFKASFNFQDRPEFKRRVLALSYGYSGVGRHNIQYQIFPLQLNTTYLKDITQDYIKILVNNPLLYYSYSDHFDLGMGVNLYYSTSKDIVPDVSYHYYRLIAESSGNLLSLFNNILPQNASGQRTLFKLPYAQFVRSEFIVGKNIRFGSKNGQALALRADVGVAFGAYGNYVSTPYEKQFYVGGASSMRGWQARTVGPGGETRLNLFSIPSQSGEFKLEFDAEYRFRLFWKLEGAIFAETGNIWMLPSTPGVPDADAFHFSDFYKTLAADWGAGLRINLNFIVLRFDFGMKVHDPSKAEGARWLGPERWFSAGGNSFHFGVGYPF